MLLYTKLERLVTYKHSSLMGLLSSYEENNVLLQIPPKFRDTAIQNHCAVRSKILLNFFVFVANKLERSSLNFLSGWCNFEA